MAKKTFYDVLQVSPNADTEIIKAAYNSLLQRFYPDGSPGDPNDDFLKALNKAYEVLSDPAKRAGYDAALSATGDVDMGQAGTSCPAIGIGKQASTKNRNEDSDYPDYEYAGFWERFAALFLDSMVLMFLSIPAWIVIWVGSIDEGDRGGAIALSGYLMVWIISAVYFSVMESGDKSATFGKRWVGLKVLDLNNQRISGGRALARWASHGFSNITLYVGYFIQPFTKQKQALHDLASGTIVVQTAREKKSSRIVIAVVAAFFMVPVIGILAAIAIPAYQDYQKRAAAQQSQPPAVEDWSSVGSPAPAVAPPPSQQSKTQHDLKPYEKRAWSGNIFDQFDSVADIERRARGHDQRLNDPRAWDAVVAWQRWNMHDMKLKANAALYAAVDEVLEGFKQNKGICRPGNIITVDAASASKDFPVGTEMVLFDCDR